LAKSGLAIAVAAACGTVGWAQETRTRAGDQDRNTTTTTGKGANALVREAGPGDMPAMPTITAQENDRRIGRWLAVESRGIVECAKLAKDHTENQQVRQFADKLVADHQKCCEMMENWGRGDSRAYPPGRNAAKTTTTTQEETTTTTRDGQTTRESTTRREGEQPRTTLQDNTPDRSRTAVVIRDNGESRNQGLVFRPTDFLAVREDVANHLQGVARKEFESCKGAEFDKAFVKHQVMAHECMLATLRSVRTNASSDLQQQIDRGVEQMQQHLNEARQLCDQVGGTHRAGDQNQPGQPRGDQNRGETGRNPPR